MLHSKGIIFTTLSITTTTLLSMGLFGFLKKPSVPKQAVQVSTEPYKDSATNIIYNLLFCDNPDLYKASVQLPYTYPFDILFSVESTAKDLQRIIVDPSADPRIKILAYNRQLAGGHNPEKKELLAVIVEVGLELGLDVLASFNNGTARYINQTGKVLIWESTYDPKANELTNELFIKSHDILTQIGPWDKPRRPRPSKGNARITFLVSDGLYFGEGPVNTLFNDKLASPALTAATHLMKYLTEKSLQANTNKPGSR